MAQLFVNANNNVMWQINILTTNWSLYFYLPQQAEAPKGMCILAPKGLCILAPKEVCILAQGGVHFSSQGVCILAFKGMHFSSQVGVHFSFQGMCILTTKGVCILILKVYFNSQGM